jgi:hypothetical protein
MNELGQLYHQLEEISDFKYQDYHEMQLIFHSGELLTGILEFAEYHFEIKI